jgi:hypothetical protein
MTVVEEMVDNQPTTWDDAAGRVVFEIFTFGLFGMNSLEDMRAQLDYMISKNSFNNKDSWMEPEEMADFWKMLASITRLTAGSLGINFLGKNIMGTQKDGVLSVSEASKLSDDISELIINKQRDYGSDNILRFGRFGLLVRVHDKIARLENLTARGTKPSNESISDNYMDVIGYATVAIMFERGWFTLPLRGK